VRQLENVITYFSSFGDFLADPVAVFVACVFPGGRLVTVVPDALVDLGLVVVEADAPWVVVVTGEVGLAAARVVGLLASPCSPFLLVVFTPVAPSCGLVVLVVVVVLGGSFGFVVDVVLVVDTRGVPVPILDGPVVPVLDGPVVPVLDGPVVPVFDGPVVPVFVGPVVPVLDGAVAPLLVAAAAGPLALLLAVGCVRLPLTLVVVVVGGVADRVVDRVEGLVVVVWAASLGLGDVGEGVVLDLDDAVGLSKVLLVVVVVLVVVVESVVLGRAVVLVWVGLLGVGLVGEVGCPGLGLTRPEVAASLLVVVGDTRLVAGRLSAGQTLILGTEDTSSRDPLDPALPTDV